VKSTAAHFHDEPFHLSRLQKLKAERMSSNGSADPPDEIFLIFRVYGLATEDAEARPGVQIYVDSGRLFEEGVLSCEVEGWLVGPA